MHTNRRWSRKTGQWNFFSAVSWFLARSLSIWYCRYCGRSYGRTGTAVPALARRAIVGGRTSYALPIATDYELDCHRYYEWHHQKAGRIILLIAMPPPQPELPSLPSHRCVLPGALNTDSVGRLTATAGIGMLQIIERFGNGGVISTSMASVPDYQ